MNKIRIISAIVAMNANRVIGKQGDLPWHYSEDLKRFKQKTMDSTIIMGRKTYQSIGSKPLPGRRNIVISRSNVPDIECYTSINEAINNVDDNIWIIGGGEIYKSAIEFCDVVDVTWVPDEVAGEQLVKFIELDPHVWHAGERFTNENDDRLVHQTFTRKSHHNSKSLVESGE